LSDVIKTKEEVLKTIAQYKELFNSDVGKIVLEDLKKRCFVNQTTFTAGDAYHTAFKEGKRYVILQILSMLNTDMKLIEKQMENNEQGEEDVRFI
jgi:hypothetical protein